MGVYGVYGVLCICSEVVSMPQHTLSQIILHGPKVLAIVRVGGKSLSFHVRAKFFESKGIRKTFVLLAK